MLYLNWGDNMKKFVFVVMPFNEDFNDIYELAIKAACLSQNMYCERVDEQYYEGSMLDRIYNQIQTADYIVADMTGKNPNVFYEVGYAHALQKKVILITQDGNDIPFDMKHFLHIIYTKNGMSALKIRLGERLNWYITSSSAEEENINLEVYMNGFFLEENTITKCKIKLYKDEFEIRDKIKSVFKGNISIVLKNPSSRPFITDNMNMTIILDDRIPLAPKYDAKILPDNNMLITRSFNQKSILSQSFWGKNINLEFDNFHHKISNILDSNYYGKIIISRPFITQEYEFEFRFFLNSF